MDRICSYCYTQYTDEEGHSSSLCVAKCTHRLELAQGHLKFAEKNLEGARIAKETNGTAGY